MGLTLFVIGIAGNALAQSYFGPVPQWELTLLFDVGVLGIVIGFFSPFIFGILLPLTE